MISYENALRLVPDFPEAHLRIGMLYVTRQQYREAAAHFEAELRRDPTHVAAARELALARTRLGEFEPAIAGLEQLVRRNPADDESWHALGFAYKGAGRMADAEKALRKAIALPPPRAIEQRDLGVLLAATGKAGAARDAYRRAAKIDPSDPSPWVNLGNLEHREQRYTKALDAYRQAERRDSNYALAMQGQVEAAVALDRADEAGATYRRWLRRRPDDTNARLEAVRLFDRLGRKDIALEIARDGVRWNERSPQTHVILGMAHEAAGDSRAALIELRTAQAMMGPGAGRDQVAALIATMRAGAPDSLRALFDADSVQHEARTP
jgi:tetratricopeptide (TPR) repeat protein